MYRKFLLSCGVAGAALWVGSLSAHAGLTEIRSPAAGEPGQEQILERLYNVDLSASGADFVGGSVRVHRVDDSADGRFSFDGPRRLDLVAAYTGWQWDYSLQDSSGRRVASGSQRGSGFNTTGGIDVPANQSLEMVLNHRSGQVRRSSDARDQLVSYDVTGANGETSRVLFWEDWARSRGSDRDYNDLVFRATSTGDLSGGGSAAAGAAPSGPVSVPLPPSVWQGAAGLLGVGTIAVRRYRRR
jgi:hypothetical protein